MYIYICIYVYIYTYRRARMQFIEKVPAGRGSAGGMRRSAPPSSPTHRSPPSPAIAREDTASLHRVEGG